MSREGAVTTMNCEILRSVTSRPPVTRQATENALARHSGGHILIFCRWRLRVSDWFSLLGRVSLSEMAQQAGGGAFLDWKYRLTQPALGLALVQLQEMSPGRTGVQPHCAQFDEVMEC